MEKSVTVTGVAGAAELLDGLGSSDPAAAVTVPLLLKPPGNGTVGVSTTVTVALPAGCRVPTEHCTVPLMGVAQLPGELVIELKVTPVVGRLSVKTTPEVGSGPALVTVNVKVTELPTPICVVLLVAVSCRSLTEPSLLTKASLGPFKAPWAALPTVIGKSLEEVDPAT